MKRLLVNDEGPVRQSMSLLAEQLAETLAVMREIILPVIGRGHLEAGDHAAISSGIVFLKDLETEMWNLQLNFNNARRFGWPLARVPQPHSVEQRLRGGVRAREVAAVEPQQVDEGKAEQ